jgi:hypothetical protein
MNTVDFICKFCSDNRKNANSLRNHERLCKLNPNKQTAKLDKAREALLIKVTCQYCFKEFTKGNIVRHSNACINNPIVRSAKEKTCPICSSFFYTESVTCSNSCANTHFRSGINNPNYNISSLRAYVRICFSFHKKECIVCKEANIVEVHHYDENHNNNSPENLIPLCPTHHQYFHSNYRYLVDKQIITYRDNFIKNIPPFEGNSYLGHAKAPPLLVGDTEVR